MAITDREYAAIDRGDYVGRAVTLNGKPATVHKDKDGWPWIAPLDTKFGTVPYSWAAVYNICDNHDGEF